MTNIIIVSIIRNQTVGVNNDSSNVTVRTKMMERTLVVDNMIVGITGG